MNRRNAALGWVTWLTAKRVLKQKTKEAVPGKVEGSRRPNKAAILAALAAIGGAIWFWRRRSDDEPSFGYDDRPSGESDPPADDAGPAVAAPANDAAPAEDAAPADDAKPADDAGPAVADPADDADPAVAEK